MTEAQKALALACIENAALGIGKTTCNGTPHCAIGWLLHCAGVPMEELPSREAKGAYAIVHPELYEVYGLEYSQVGQLIHANDSNNAFQRREAVLSLIASFPCESETK